MKLNSSAICFAFTLSFPTRERGLKCKAVNLLELSAESFPTRERGLKCNHVTVVTRKKTSFPTRERGLKYKVNKKVLTNVVVVPHEGTWIEILTMARRLRNTPSFPTRERGLKCVLHIRYSISINVVPHEGTWIEILFGTYLSVNLSVVPHEGTWIEITEGIIVNETQATSFPTRERGLKFCSRSLPRTGHSRSPRGNVD